MTGSRKQAGFTLVEIMTVVAIISILAVIAIPSFARLMPRIKLANATSNLANEIAGQRMQAIAKSKRFRIEFDIAGKCYRLKQSNTSGGFDNYSTITMSGTDLVSAVVDPTDATQSPKPYLEIRGTGGTNVPLGSQAIILLKTPNSDLQKQILVEATGRVIIQKKGSGGSWVTE